VPPKNKKLVFFTDKIYDLYRISKVPIANEREREREYKAKGWGCGP
jgi:hypothetical protein